MKETQLDVRKRMMQTMTKSFCTCLRESACKSDAMLFVQQVWGGSISGALPFLCAGTRQRCSETRETFRVFSNYLPYFATNSVNKKNRTSYLIFHKDWPIRLLLSWQKKSVIKLQFLCVFDKN